MEIYYPFFLVRRQLHENSCLYLFPSHFFHRNHVPIFPIYDWVAHEKLKIQHYIDCR